MSPSPAAQPNDSPQPDGRLVGVAIFLAALLVYGLVPSRNSLYADDSLAWAWDLSQGSGLINSHHFYLNALKAVYASGLGAAWHWNPALFLASYSALWGAVGLFTLYELLRLLGCGRASLPGTIVCACMSGYWSYAIVGDVYVPATAALLLGVYSLLRGLSADSRARRARWFIGSTAAFLVMILHHQAYAWYVGGLLLAIPAFGRAHRQRAAVQVVAVVCSTAVLSLAVYAAVYAAGPNPGHRSFLSFISGYVDSSRYQTEPDQESLAPTMLLKAAAGEARAVFPYYVAFRSERITRFAQGLFPYRALYAYPYLVRSLDPLRVALVVAGLLAAALTGAWLVAIGFVRVCSSRGRTFAILVAGVPQAVFFVWWLGVSDEFWIWSLPLVAILASTGAVETTVQAGSRPDRRGGRRPSPAHGVMLLVACAAGLFVSTSVGAVALFADPANDIDAVECAFAREATSRDLVLGLDRIQPAARINLWRLRQGFQYVNVFDRAAQWSDADLEAVKRAARDAVARGGRVLVGPYLSRPPGANIEWIRRLNPAFPQQWSVLMEFLRSLPPGRVEWSPELVGYR